MIVTPTKEEISLLSNIEQRHALFLEKPFKIGNRVFGKDVRFDSFEWQDIEFVNCDFLACTMFRGFLNKVRFSNCLFVANLWEDDKWEDVTFTDCAWRGPFKMSTPYGRSTLLFDNCDFTGATAEEMGYGGKSECFGRIGGTNGHVKYMNCRFERTFINGGASLMLLDCKLADTVIDGQDDSSVLLTNIDAKGLVDFGSRMGKFSTVTVKDSKFEDLVTFGSAKIKNALFENVRVNLDLTLVKSENIILRRMIFMGSAKPEPQYQFGLRTESAKIATLSIEDCTFQGDGAALYLQGEVDSAKPSHTNKLGKEHVNIYSTGIGSLTVRNTPINRGRFGNMDIDVLLLEDLKVADTDFSHGKIGKLIMRNVGMSGKVEFIGTTIKERVSERVTDTSTGTPPTLSK